MNAADLLAALDLPTAARVERRVPKTMLTEHGAPTAADKRRINDGIEQLLWVAALKPTTIGVAAYRDEVREYLEIAVLHLTLRAGWEGSLVGPLDSPRRGREVHPPATTRDVKRSRRPWTGAVRPRAGRRAVLRRSQRCSTGGSGPVRVGRPGDGARAQWSRK